MFLSPVVHLIEGGVIVGGGFALLSFEVQYMKVYLSGFK